MRFLLSRLFRHAADFCDEVAETMEADDARERIAKEEVAALRENVALWAQAQLAWDQAEGGSDEGELAWKVYEKALRTLAEGIPF